MTKNSVSVLAPFAAAFLLSACTAAELEQLRTQMQRVAPATASTLGASPSGGLSEAAARAEGVRVGQVVEGRITAVGESDEFTFVGTKGQELVLYEQVESGYLTGTIFDSSGFGGISRVTASPKQPLEASHTQVFTLPADDTYRLRFEASQSTLPTSYRFVIRPLVRAPEKIESAIRIAEVVSGETIDSFGDIDEFSFTGTKGDRVVAYAQVSTGYLKVEVRDAAKSGRVLDMTVSPGQPLERSHSQPVTLPETGAYLVRVSGSQGTYPQAYRFQIRPVQ